MMTGKPKNKKKSLQDLNILYMNKMSHYNSGHAIGNYAWQSDFASPPFTHILNSKEKPHLMIKMLIA
jgi:hypothetical protein